jgi:branched-subunit amino acid aminotransferase/4-amino-4-deoxychorismate lyase
MKQVPPPGKGSLYIRPLLIGSGPVLNLVPAPEYSFLIYASPVGNYHKVGYCLIGYAYLVMINFKTNLKYSIFSRT